MPDDSLSLDTARAAAEPAPAAGGARGARRDGASLRLVPPRPPLAAATSPLPAPLTTFERFRLIATGDGRLALADTAAERLFRVTLLCVVVALAAHGATGLDETAVRGWLPLGAAAALLVLALAATRSGEHVVFDGEAREFRRTRGRVPPGRAGAVDPDPDGARAVGLRSIDGARFRVAFDEIVAVQRLSCPVADEEVSWTVHQINLVRRDGSRVHVCAHVDEANARRNAETVARFVGVEVQPRAAEVAVRGPRHRERAGVSPPAAP